MGEYHFFLPKRTDKYKYPAKNIPIESTKTSEIAQTLPATKS